MKKYLILLSFLSFNCFAIDPYTVLITQIDSAGNFQMTRFLPQPSEDAYMRYDRTNNTVVWSLASSISMESSQISDTSSVGRGLMTSSNEAAARAAIGAGTSNFSGDYPDLSNKPTNLSQFTNGPGYVTAATAPVTSVNGSTGAVTLNAASVGAAADSHTHTASQISDSTTIGRSLLTATDQAAVKSIAGIPDAQVNSDWSATSGVSQILNKPATYTGTTNGSGIYSVTYGSAYSSKPKVLFAVEGGTNKDTSLLTSTTTTGFSILVERRTDIAGLLPTYAAVSGITVNVYVIP
jgi:hypothetical protein